MKIFIDSADLDEIREAFSWGIVDGITTNPSLIKKAIAGKDVNMADYIKDILSLAQGKPVSLEIDGEQEGKIRSEQMIKEARSLYHRFKEHNGKLNIKVPINPAMSKDDDHQFEGLKAIRTLSQEDIPVNATLIMTPEQALLAAKAGAKFISPFMGRIDDYVKKNQNQGINSGIKLMKETGAALKNYPFSTEAIGASVRNIEHVRELAKLGADIATIPFQVLKEMIIHEKTYEGVKKFKEDVVPEYRALLRS